MKGAIHHSPLHIHVVQICFYCFIIIIIIIIIVVVVVVVVVSCHRPILPGNSLELTVIPTAQDSSFTLQYFPYCV